MPITTRVQFVCLWKIRTYCVIKCLVREIKWNLYANEEQWNYISYMWSMMELFIYLFSASGIICVSESDHAFCKWSLCSLILNFCEILKCDILKNFGEYTHACYFCGNNLLGHDEFCCYFACGRVLQIWLWPGMINDKLTCNCVEYCI